MKNKNLTIWFTVILSIFLLSTKPVLAQVDFTWSGICVNSQTQFTSIVPNPAIITSWHWDFGDGGTSNIQNPIHTYIGTEFYTVILTVINTSGVTSSVSHQLVINQLPVANFTTNNPNCSNSPVQFVQLSYTSIGYITHWIWNYGDGSPNDTIVFPPDPNYPDNPNVTHWYSYPGTYYTTLTIINSISCSNSITLPVTVNPAPIANFYYTSHCEDESVQFSDASIPGGTGSIVSWNWNFGDSASGLNNSSNLANPAHIYQITGAYVVMQIVTDSYGCSDTVARMISIYQKPYVDFTYTGSCQNNLIYFDPNPTVTNINSIATWLWDFGDGGTSNSSNTAHTYAAIGNYTVTLSITDTLGCSNSVSHVVNVQAPPIANFNTSMPACAGNAVQFTNLSSTTSGYITSWVWNFGDGNTTTVVYPNNPNVAHTYTLAGTFNATLTITNSEGCSASVTHSINIYPQPVAEFSFTTPLCFGAPVHFTDLSQIPGGTIVQWYWDFGDPATGILNTTTIQNPDHIFSALGTYNVQLIVTSSYGCSDTIYHTVTVNPGIQIGFTFSNNCQNSAVVFTPVVNGANIITWLWEFGDGTSSTLQYPTHTYSIAGTYIITLTVSDNSGCTEVFSMPVLIYAQPFADFSSSAPVCSGSDVAFTDLSMNPSGGIVYQWDWDFNDPNTGTNNYSNLQNPHHLYETAGGYNVMLIATNTGGCKDTIIKPIVINFHPQADFSFSEPQLNTPVQFTDQSVAALAIITGWNWNFGDGNNSDLQNPIHIYTIPGYYTVQLTVTDAAGCSNSADSILVVPPGANSLTIVGKVYSGSTSLNTATVRLIQLDSTGFPISMTSTVPDAGNNFTFTNVPEGSYYLHAFPFENSVFSSTFLPTFYFSSVYWENAATIILGSAQNPYDIHLVPFNIENGGAYSINGQLVLGDKSMSVAGQEILLLDSQNNPVGYAFTDANGYFSFTSLPSGTYAVNPVITGYTTYPYYVVLNGNTNPAFVKFTISGHIITGFDKPVPMEQTLQIFPNPASESITVKLNKIVAWFNIDIFSVNGELMLNKIVTDNSQSQVIIGSLTKGLYLVKVTDNNGNCFVERLIKQ